MPNPADEVRRDLGAVKFSQVALDLPHRHAARVEAQNLVVKTIEPGLMLANELRLKATGPVARHRNLDLAVFGQYRLGTGAIAAVAAAAAGRIAFLVAQMLGQLSSQRPFNQRLL